VAFDLPVAARLPLFVAILFLLWHLGQVAGFLLKSKKRASQLSQVRFIPRLGFVTPIPSIMCLFVLIMPIAIFLRPCQKLKYVDCWQVFMLALPMTC
jgi:hypothetical protein